MQGGPPQTPRSSHDESHTAWPPGEGPIWRPRNTLPRRPVLVGEKCGSCSAQDPEPEGERALGVAPSVVPLGHIPVGPLVIGSNHHTRKPSPPSSRGGATAVDHPTPSLSPRHHPRSLQAVQSFTLAARIGLFTACRASDAPFSSSPVAALAHGCSFHRSPLTSPVAARARPLCSLPPVAPLLTVTLRHTCVLAAAEAVLGRDGFAGSLSRVAAGPRTMWYIRAKDAER